MAGGEGGGDGGRPGEEVEEDGCGGSTEGDVGAAAPRRGTPPSDKQMTSLLPVINNLTNQERERINNSDVPASAREQEVPHYGDNPSCSHCRTETHRWTQVSTPDANMLTVSSGTKTMLS